MDYKTLKLIQANDRFREAIQWGEPRDGHEEGSIENHILDLCENAEKLREAGHVREEEWYKLLALIHVHDAFKGESVEKIAIVDPRSHASIATKFLSAYTSDKDLLNMCQYHDEWFAIYNRQKRNGGYDFGDRTWQRLNNLIHLIEDWHLFILFMMCDTCTPSKSRNGLLWFLEETEGVFADSPDWESCLRLLSDA